MTEKLKKLYRIEKDDVGSAAEVLVNAFKESPVWKAIYGDSTPEQKKAIFEIVVRYGLKYGEVYAPSENLEGVAAWLPGQYAEITVSRIFASGLVSQILSMGLKNVKKYFEIFQPIEQDRQEYMGGNPYIYLEIIGVARRFQGQGHGRMLLEALIEKSKKQGLPVYLETDTEENVSIYERFGFDVIKMVELSVIELPYWEMVRYPQ